MECADVRERLSAYQAGDLDGDGASAVRAHLEVCQGCRRLLEDLRALDALCADLSSPGLAPQAGERVLASIHRALGSTEPAPAGEVWTPEEVARFLKVEPAAVYAMVEHMPFFSFGGQYRIRKTSLMAWIEEQEGRSRRSAAFAFAQGR